MKRLFLIFMLITACCLEIMAQDSPSFRITVYRKDEPPVTGTAVRITMSEVELVSDPPQPATRIIKREQISRIEFLSTPETPKAPSVNALLMRCGTVAVPVPEVRGFRLGMPWDEYQHVSPKLVHFSNENNEEGVRRDYLTRSDFYRTSGDRFKSIDHIELLFLDDKLASIEVNYDTSTEWPNALEFTAAIADALKLPRTGWRGHDTAVLTCDEFGVETSVDILGRGKLQIMKFGVTQEIERRKQANEEKSRKIFKP